MRIYYVCSTSSSKSIPFQTLNIGGNGYHYCSNTGCEPGEPYSPSGVCGPNFNL
jgi:hypothetical protein